MKRLSLLIIDALLAASLLCGCVSDGPAPATPTASLQTPVLSPSSQPDPTPTVTPAPTPTLTPDPTPTLSPTPTPTPTPTPVAYELESFLPLEDIHIRYESPDSSDYRETYVEYTDEDSHAVQHRVFSNSSSSPEVTVTYCEDGQLIQKRIKNSVGFTYNFLSEKGASQQVLLKEPLVEGNSWAVEGGTRTITNTDHIIDMPLGAYRALEVTTEYTSGKRTVQYYVPDFGLVAEYSYEGGKLTGKLEAVSTDTDQGFTQLIRFYFAQPNTDSIKYENRSVTVKPNASMASRFVNQFRSVPTGSGLFALDGISIRSIRRDSHGYIHVDFGESLTAIVSNVGRATENLLITALTNTFCDYYQTDRLYLTVEGQPYESPYRFLLEGEYFSPNYSKASPYKS